MERQSLLTNRILTKNVRIWKACHTRRRFHCVAAVFLNFTERRGKERSIWIFSWNWLPMRCPGHDAATEFAQRFIAFLWSLHGAYLCSHGAFTTLSWRSRRIHGAFTALTLRHRRVKIQVSSWLHQHEINVSNISRTFTIDKPCHSDKNN